MREDKQAGGPPAAGLPVQRRACHGAPAGLPQGRGPPAGLPAGRPQLDDLLLEPRQQLHPRRRGLRPGNPSLESYSATRVPNLDPAALPTTRNLEDILLGVEVPRQHAASMAARCRYINFCHNIASGCLAEANMHITFYAVSARASCRPCDRAVVNLRHACRRWASARPCRLRHSLVRAPNIPFAPAACWSPIDAFSNRSHGASR